jgi:amino acid adenylation domain-containing protein
LIHELVADRARAHPEALALSAPDAQLTYAELDGRSNQLAHLLRASGVGVETRVGLCLERSAALVVGALGILKAGGGYVALDPSSPPQRLEFMLGDAGVAAVVTSPSLAGQVGSAAPTIIALDSSWAALDGGPADALDAVATADNLAYLIYTSGSTGTPKGVMLEHRGLSNLVRWHREAFAVAAGDRCTQIASPGFDASVWEVWPALAAGASVHIPTDDVRGRPELLRDWLIAERIAVSFLPTPLAEAVMALDWPAEVALRSLLTGGDVLHRHPAPSLPFAVVNNYGPAEGTVVATSGVVPPREDSISPPSLGRPIAGVDILVVDDHLQPVAPGHDGELLIGGAGVARGYVNQPVLTDERFVSRVPGASSGGRMYRTGDRVRLIANGELEFLGRLDDQVKISGQRIELREISANLDGHAGVRSSVVVIDERVPGEKRLVAYVVPHPNTSCDPDLLRSSLAQRLPAYMLPQEFVILDELPVTMNGKVDRAALPAPPAPVPSASQRPLTELEASLADIVAELLGHGTVGVDDNFFLLGGHSLLGAQLIARIADNFAAELPLRTLFDHPTVAGMALEVERLLVADLDAMSEEEAERLAAALRWAPEPDGQLETSGNRRAVSNPRGDL